MAITLHDDGMTGVAEDGESVTLTLHDPDLARQVAALIDKAWPGDKGWSAATAALWSAADNCDDAYV